MYGKKRWCLPGPKLLLIVLFTFLLQYGQYCTFNPASLYTTVYTAESLIVGSSFGMDNNVSDVLMKVIKGSKASGDLLMFFDLLSWNCQNPNQLALTTMPYTCMPVCQWCVFPSCYTFKDWRMLGFTLWIKIIWRDLTSQDIGVANQTVLDAYFLRHQTSWMWISVHIEHIFIHTMPSVPYFTFFSLDVIAGLWGPLWNTYTCPLLLLYVNILYKFGVQMSETTIRFFFQLKLQIKRWFWNPKM